MGREGEPGGTRRGRKLCAGCSPWKSDDQCRIEMMAPCEEPGGGGRELVETRGRITVIIQIGKEEKKRENMGPPSSQAGERKHERGKKRMITSMFTAMAKSLA